MDVSQLSPNAQATRGREIECALKRCEWLSVYGVLKSQYRLHCPNCRLCIHGTLLPISPIGVDRREAGIQED